MGELFNLDNPVWSFMGKVADLIILNILAVICSLPIFTIGASWTALYFVTIRMVRKEESYIVKDFFRSFKENFKQATIIWLIVLAMSAVLAGDILICRMLPDQIPQIISLAVAVLAFWVFGTIVYIFPVLSRFQNTIKNTLKNAFLISVLNIPYTILIMVLIVLPFVLAFFVYQAAPFVIAMGFSLPAYIASLMLVRIFRKLEPAEESGAENEEVIEENSGI